MLVRFTYQRLSKSEKGVIRQCIKKMSGYSRAQVCRLIRKFKLRGQIRKADSHKRRFPTKYTTRDIALLASTDELHDFLSGPATKKVMEREWKVFGHAEFKVISQLSIVRLSKKSTVEK